MSRICATEIWPSDTSVLFLDDPKLWLICGKILDNRGGHRFPEQVMAPMVAFELDNAPDPQPLTNRRVVHGGAATYCLVPDSLLAALGWDS
jgi:hypothetical protein